MRGGKNVEMKEKKDKEIEIEEKKYVMVKKVMVVRRKGGKVRWGRGRDMW